jgi:hypothetical protein
MQTSSGFNFVMQQRIIAKLLSAGATSREKAITAQEARLDAQEQNWLYYIAGGLNSKVKKTKNKKYYVPTYQKR